MSFRSFNRRAMLPVLVLIAAILGACSGLAGEPEVVSTLPPATPRQPLDITLDFAPDIELGALIYAENCTACHGPAGAGDGAMVLNGQIASIPDMTDAAARAGKTPAEYFEIITVGRLETLMPPWEGSLSEAQRWAVAYYTYNLPYTAEALARGEEVWATECASCHGPNGEGGADGPELAYGLPELSDEVIVGLLLNGQGEMPAFDELPAADRAAVAAYARTLRLEGDAVSVAAADTAPLPSATEEVGASAAPAAEGTAEPLPEMVPGIVTGQVVNISEGGTVPQDMLVTLHILDRNLNEELEEQVVGADGSFRFENVPVYPDRGYALTVEYGEMIFPTTIQTGDPLNPEMDFTLEIREFTSDPSVLSVDFFVTQVDREGDTTQIVELMSLSNTSDRIFLSDSTTEGGLPVSVSLELPEGAVFAGGTTDPHRFIPTSDGRIIQDTEPVQPGEGHLLHMVYTLPSGSREVQRVIPYPVNGAVELYVAEEAFQASSSLSALGSSDFNGFPFLRYASEVTQPAGYTVDFTLNPVSAQAGTSGAAVPTNTIATILIGAGIGFMLAAGFFALRGRNAAPAVAPASSPAPGPVSSGDEAQELVRQIAELDQRHQSGEIEEVRYLRERDALKARLVEVMKSRGQS